MVLGLLKGKGEDGEAETFAVGVGVPTGGPLAKGVVSGLVYTGCAGECSWSPGSLVANEPAPSWAGRPRRGQCIQKFMSGGFCLCRPERRRPQSRVRERCALLPISQLSSCYFLFFILQAFYIFLVSF